jgi:thiol-disulfide isomerase/thioredoxin
LCFLLTSMALLCGARAEDLYPSLALGSPAPDFDLPGVDGRNWALKDFKSSKFLVVVFTCNHCPTAQHYEERIKQIVTDYQGRGVAVVGIMPNDPRALRPDELGWTDLSDSFPEMKLRAEERHFNFPYLYDGDTEAVAHAYGPAATPHAFVFDAERKLRYAGGVDDSERAEHAKKHYLRDALDALLAGKEPPLAQTKVIGCSTKWSEKRPQVKAYLDKLAAEPVSLGKADTNALRSLRHNDSGKLRLVNFWATWCAPCLGEFDGFVALSRIYRPRELEFVSVSLNSPDDEKRVLEFLKKQQAANRNLIFASDDRASLINAFNPAWQGEVPYTVLLGSQGELIYTETGSVDFLALKRAILKAANEREK